MKVIALVGKSGTGKSYKAVGLAYEKNIKYIIDDGLLIKGNKILEGKSAKREQTRISAVKRALFLEVEHREIVSKTIKEENPSRILIIGTSEKMVRIISENLSIDPIDEMVFIEEISTEEEIALAQRLRKIEGKHVIPVPTFELKKHFSGYFIDALKIFKRKRDNTFQITEKSVVRPTFSYMGKYVISDKAIYQIIKYESQDIEGLHKILRIHVVNYPNGIVINIDATLEYGHILHRVMEKLQRKIYNQIEKMTSINVLAINVIAKNLKI